MSSAQELVKSADLDGALAALTQEVKKRPADPSLRIFLFQLLTVMGQYDRAMTQLNVSADMDRTSLLMAQVCRQLLNCEALRADVFAGRRTPLVFGEPSDWLGKLIQAVGLIAKGHTEAAAKLREEAFAAADAIPGTIDGQAFEWIADADSRLGPLFELIVEGRYYWAPIGNLKLLKIPEPSDLRDLVWTPVDIVWKNGGTTVGFMPVRYPGADAEPDPLLKLSRKTEWIGKEHDTYLGMGQRMLTTDQGDHPILECREIRMDS